MGASTPRRAPSSPGHAHESSSSEDDVGVPGSRKKRLLTENFDRIRITGELTQVPEAELGRAADEVESVGTMRSKEDASASQPVPPSTKKRKGVKKKVTSHAALRSLAELSRHFGDMQLNKDYYDSIKQTESRCSPGENVRDVDRQAFRDALAEVEQLIRVQHNANHRGRPRDCECERGEEDVISLVALSLDVIQFLIDNNTMTSSTATTGVTLEHSLSKSTSQNVNTSEVIESPWKAKKHPRRSTSFQEGEAEGGTGRRPSRQPSLISNEPPKRQRKYEMDEVSSKPAVEDAEVDELKKSNESSEKGGRDENTLDEGTRQEKTVQDGHEGYAMPQAIKDETDGATTEDEKRSRSHTHASSKRDSAAKSTVDTVNTGNDAHDAPQDRRDDNRCSINASDGDEKSKKPVWRSSLVCADLSLNDVGSRIYGPLILSLRSAGLVGVTDLGNSCRENDEDIELIESLIRTHAAPTEESQELGSAVFSVVENIYFETYGLRNTNIVQKALSLVVEAFHLIMKDCLLLRYESDDAGSDSARDDDEGGDEEENG